MVLYACIQIYTLIQIDNNNIRNFVLNLVTNHMIFFITEKVQFIGSSDTTGNNLAFILKPCDFTFWDMISYLGHNLTDKDIFRI